MRKSTTLSQELFIGKEISPIIKSDISEEFRAIKREVLMSAFNEDNLVNKNRIMITSVNPKEGKSFCAYNLARSISYEQDKQVLLVDCNVLSPKLATSDSNTPGLIDYLMSDKYSVQDIINNSNIDQLKVISLGSNSDYSNELLSGKKMLDLLNEFRERYSDRVVIFDAPPLLGVNEAITLSHHIDQLILVVNEGVTNISDLEIVKKRLPEKTKTHYILNKSLTNNSWKTN